METNSQGAERTDIIIITQMPEAVRVLRIIPCIDKRRRPRLTLLSIPSPINGFYWNQVKGLSTYDVRTGIIDVVNRFSKGGCIVFIELVSAVVECGKDGRGS